MKAYVRVAETIKGEGMFAEYRKKVVLTIAALGNRPAARGRDLTILESEGHIRGLLSSSPHHGPPPRAGTNPPHIKRSSHFALTARWAI